MNRRSIIVLSVCLAGILGYVLVKAWPVPPDEDDTEAASRANAREEEARLRERAAYERQTQARIAEMSAMETRRSMQAQAAARSTQARFALQAQRQPVWLAVINTNAQAFHELRKTATAAKSRTAQCTLCDGVGLMQYCILCGHRGKCVSCNGSGKMFGTEVCPACLGTGKCHVCFGMGKMPCPFCDDGVIKGDTPFPPSTMPAR